MGTEKQDRKNGWALPTMSGEARLSTTKYRARSAHKTALSSPLCAASIRRERAVVLGEHCLSTWLRSGSCELRSPACLRLIEGTRRAANRGRLLWVTFIGKTRKVTCCRATPGGFYIQPYGAMHVRYCSSLRVKLNISVHPRAISLRPHTSISYPLVTLPSSSKDSPSG